MIEVKDLHKSFGNIKALDGISFIAKDCKVTGVIGPDGAGKTTLCRILSCVMSSDSGDCFVDSLSCSQQAEKVKRIIGYMPRDYGLYPDLTVSENMDFYADLFGIYGKEKKERKEKILSAVRMDKFQNRRSGLLSGGMKQKLQLSCSLIHSPKYLILDEPSYGVDPVSRRDFWKLVDDISKNTTIIVSTSYMDESEHFDDMIILNKGKIVKNGTPEEVIKSVPYKMYRIKSDRLIEFSKKTENMYKNMNLYGDKMHVVFDDKFSLESLKTDEFVDYNIEIEEITPSMEDAFIYFTM